MSTPPDRDIGHLLRDLAPQVLGVVARRNADFALAEDAVQDALIAAATQWERDGIPDNPHGWLYHVAMRRLTDHLRSELARRRREDAVATMYFADETAFTTPDVDAPAEGDEALVLLLMCCHVSLTPPSAIALTLRAVGGLTTAEIASAFFVPEATMAQRISRAKQAIKASKVSFALPGDVERRERLGAVLHVLYLVFNEGYASSSGAELARVDLSNEAIRLARLLHAQLPDDDEVSGLLALMLLTDARRDARTGEHGELIPLDEQDRARWNSVSIAEGTALVSAAFGRGSLGMYQLQAAIAAIHDSASHVDDTDWREILMLYGLLERIAPNPMITLNRAIAVAMVEGPRQGLALLDTLDTDSRIRGHYRLDAVRGHLYERAGDLSRAVTHYRAAALGTASIPERDYLAIKAAAVAARAGMTA